MTYREAQAMVEAWNKAHGTRFYVAAVYAPEDDPTSYQEPRYFEVRMCLGIIIVGDDVRGACAEMQEIADLGSLGLIAVDP